MDIDGVKPRIGMTFETEKDAFEFYNVYGGVLGFSVRRSSVKRSDDKTVITYRKFVCSKERHRGIDKRDVDTTTPRAETRTDCGAKMGVSRLPSGLYECRVFVEEHNHELHTKATTHYMRSQRSMSSLDELAIDLAAGSGIKPKASFDLLGMQAGGKNNIGFIQQDLRNYLRTKRQKALEYGDVGGLTSYFQTQSRISPSFTVSTQFDSDEQITNVFWADPRMLIDYALFGDVVSFDTTFCTNSKYRPLGIFAGFNHHRGAVIFGAALLYDETIESFTWLFERFLEAHNHKMPITIFTDQDASMAVAIAKVLLDTWHGLCTWHLMQNGVNHHGNLMKEGSSFLRDLKRCVYEYLDEQEFEEAWKKFRAEYPVEKTSWLDKIYGIKEKWASCFMKNTFTLGIRSTQLSESINADLKDHLDKRLDVPRFFEHFERVVEDKRENELKAEFESRNKLPKKMGYCTPILNHAGKVYTPAAYELFLEEFIHSGYCYVGYRDENHFLCQYGVEIVNAEGESQNKSFIVLYSPSDCKIQCSCKKFESLGILCRHAIKILEIRCLKSIPDGYILRRWTRGAREMVVEDSQGREVIEDVRLDSRKRFSFIVPKAIRTLTQACYSVESFDVANTAVDSLSDQIKNFHLVDPIQPSVQCDEFNRVMVLKQNERQKGGKRHKSWNDPRYRPKKTAVPRTQGVEFSEPIIRMNDPHISHVLQQQQSYAPYGFHEMQEQHSMTSMLMSVPSSQGSASTPSLSQTSGGTLGNPQCFGLNPNLFHHFGN